MTEKSKENLQDWGSVIILGAMVTSWFVMAHIETMTRIEKEDRIAIINCNN